MRLLLLLCFCGIAVLIKAAVSGRKLSDSTGWRNSSKAAAVVMSVKKNGRNCQILGRRDRRLNLGLHEREMWWTTGWGSTQKRSETGTKRKVGLASFHSTTLEATQFAQKPLDNPQLSTQATLDLFSWFEAAANFSANVGGRENSHSKTTESSEGKWSRMS